MALAPDLRKRIEIMAEHIARNGPEFENTVKQKNLSNPQFAFLYNGEGADYYNQVLAAHRREAHCQVVGGTGSGRIDPDLAEILQRWKEPPVYPLSVDIERQLGEVVASLEHMASRDAIRSGRLWIECNSAVAPQIASHTMRRIVFLPTCAHRLHVLYLVHDVLQTEAARKETLKPLIRAFRPYLAWILRPAYQLAQTASPSGDESARVLRLLQLWEDRGILTAVEGDELRLLVTATELPGRPPGQGTGARASTAPPRPSATPASRATGLPAAGYPAPHPVYRTAGPAPMGMQYGAPGPGQYPPYYPRPRPHGSVGLAPGMQAYRPQAGPPLTPETVPVGVLATLLAQVKHRVAHIDFIPYRPLDPGLAPQVLPPIEVPTQRLLQRIEDFYQDLRDEEREQGSSSSSRSSSRSRSRSPSGGRYDSQSRTSPNTKAAMNAVPPPID